MVPFLPLVPGRNSLPRRSLLSQRFVYCFFVSPETNSTSTNDNQTYRQNDIYTADQGHGAGCSSLINPFSLVLALFFSTSPFLALFISPAYPARYPLPQTVRCHHGGREYGNSTCHARLHTLSSDFRNPQMQSKSSARARVPGGLKEANSAFTNARSGLMQPGTIAKQSSLSRTAISSAEWNNWLLKADRLSELSRSKSTTQAPETRRVGTTTSRSANGPPKAHGRANSVASSSTSTRTTSRAANGSSTTRQPPRSQSSLAGPRKHTGPSIPRPATSLDTHEEEPAGSVLGKRKGRRQSHFLFSNAASSLTGPLSGVHGDGPRNRIRTQASLPNFRSASFESGGRMLSLCTAMDQLDLNPPPTGSPCHQPVQDGPKKSPSKIPTICTPVKSFDRPPSFPKFPSKRHPSPIVPFLTKDTTVKTFNQSTDSEWNQENRDKKLDELYETFMSRFSQAGQESFGLKETVELYKTRSKYLGHILSLNMI